MQTFVLGVVPHPHGTRHCHGPAASQCSFPEAAASFHRLPPVLFLDRRPESSDHLRFTVAASERERERRREDGVIEATTAAMRRWREEVVALSLRGYGYGNEDDDRPEKPRRYGVTEMRSPFYSFRPANQALQVRCRFTPVPTSRRPGPVLCSNPFGIGLRRAGLDAFWFDFERAIRFRPALRTRICDTHEPSRD